MRKAITYILLVLHVYVGARLVPALAAWPAAGIALAGLLLCSAVLTGASFLYVRKMPLNAKARSLAWTGFLFLGLFSSLLIFTVLRDIALGALAWWRWMRPMPGLWHGVRTESALLVIGAAWLVTLIGLFQARRTPRVKHVDVPIAGLPEALQGFTIAQISDLHVGATIKADYVTRVVNTVNVLKADMVAITGDLVDADVDELVDDVSPLARLASRHGTFFVTGNHEYYHGAMQWIVALRALNMHVLLNEHAVLRHDGVPLVVAGVIDPIAARFEPGQRSDPRAALDGVPDDSAVKVLLAHRPGSATTAVQAGFDLQLSGHTHGGQFLPWRFFVRLRLPFSAGLYRLQNMWLYISQGTGYWGPPNRFGVPSEVTLLRLVRRP